mgnify:CR=1 FL=1
MKFNARLFSLSLSSSLSLFLSPVFSLLFFCSLSLSPPRSRRTCRVVRVRVRQEVRPELRRLEAESVDERVGPSDALGHEGLVRHFENGMLSMAKRVLAGSAEALLGWLGRGARAGGRHFRGRENEEM